jgi:hypothetical protein
VRRIRIVEAIANCPRDVRGHGLKSGSELLGSICRAAAKPMASTALKICPVSRHVATGLPRLHVLEVL